MRHVSQEGFDKKDCFGTCSHQPGTALQHCLIVSGISSLPAINVCRVTALQIGERALQNTEDIYALHLTDQRPNLTFMREYA